MAGNGAAKKKKRRYFQSEPYKAAMAAKRLARMELTAARSSGSLAKIHDCQSKLDRAQEQLARVYMLHFERVCELRTGAAARCMEDLMRLVGQKRFVVSAEHARAILAVLDEAISDLKAALQTAQARRQEHQKARRVQFRPPDLQLDVEGFLQDQRKANVLGN